MRTNAHHFSQNPHKMRTAHIKNFMRTRASKSAQCAHFPHVWSHCWWVTFRFGWLWTSGLESGVTRYRREWLPAAVEAT
jgi:hypothetical protein